MKTNQKKWIVILGVVVVLLNLASSWYSVNFNESRILAPMDYSEYIFQWKDLPMIASVVLAVLYMLYIMFFIIKTDRETKRQVADSNKTRKISPFFGFFGCFGFLGFLGFYTYHLDKNISPFFAFAFLGFFGFFYEGKMSGILMDERYRENLIRAQLTALKTAFVIIGVTLFLVGSGRLLGNLEYTLIAMVILVSLAFALALFLSEYLLYRYDHDDLYSESEE